MKLDKDNYEAWLLDRMEGRLSVEQVRQLEIFLAAHPDLPAGPGGMPVITEGTEVFPWKDQLRRQYPPVGVPDAGRLDDFLIARLEGDLNAEQELLLARYLYEHPEAARQADLIGMAKVPAGPLAFPGKDQVHRELPPEGMPDAIRLTDFLVAEMEGDLSVEQQRALSQWLKDHPGAEREKRLLAAARVPVQALTYPHKQGLKRQRAVVRPLWPRLAAVASIALVATAVLWLWRNPETGSNHLAQTGEHGTATPETPQTGAANGASASKPSEPATPMSVPIDATVPTAGVEQKTAIHTHPRHPEGRPRPVQPKDSLPAQAPATAPRMEEKPLLAQGAVVLEQAVAVPPDTQEAAPTELLAANSTPPQTGQTLGGFMVNTLRREVLESPQRKSGLDGKDAWAMADKALGWASQGKAGVSKKEGTTRDRVRVRFGKNFSISASTSR